MCQEELRLVPSLSDAQLAELGEIAIRIEDHYGFPQDVEWGLADGRFAILQSRQITGGGLDFADGSGGVAVAGGPRVAD